MFNTKTQGKIEKKRKLEDNLSRGSIYEKEQVYIFDRKGEKENMYSFFSLPLSHYVNHVFVHSIVLMIINIESITQL